MIRPSARPIAFAAILLLLPVSAFATTIVVNAANPDGWAFSNADNSGTNASGGFVAGPGTPPLGTGSAEFTVGDTSSSEILYNTALYNGMSVSNFTAFSYATYRAAPSGVVTEPTFDVNVSFTNGATYGGRFVFEPYLSGAATSDATWQTWDPMTAAGWYWSHAPANGACSQGKPCTWAALLSTYPDAAVDYGVLFKAGSGSADWVGFDGNVDDLQIATTIGGVTSSNTYDFEPVPEPRSIALFSLALLSLGMVRLRRRA